MNHFSYDLLTDSLGPSGYPNPTNVKTIYDSQIFQNAVKTICQKIEYKIQSLNDCRSGAETNNPNDFRNIELKLLTNRILDVLLTAIEKIQIIFYLPFIVTYLKVNKNSFSDDVKRICIENEKDVKFIVTSGTKLIELLTNFQVNQSDLINCINLTYKYNFRSLFAKYLGKLMEGECHFLMILNDLKKNIGWRLIMLAPHEMIKMKILHKMWIENPKLFKKLNEIKKEQINNKTPCHGEQIDSMANKIKQINEINLDAIKNRIYVSSLIMNKTAVESKIFQKELSEKFEISKVAYQDLLKINLIEEKKLREQKLRGQQKVQAWITKYDTEFGSKMNQLYILKDQLADINEKCEQFQIEFDKQEILYNKVVQEQEKELAIKVLLFKRKRAVCMLQKAWRMVLKKRKKKQKANKKRR